MQQEQKLQELNLLTISHRAETKANPRKISDSRKGVPSDTITTATPNHRTSAKFGKGLPKAPFLRTILAPSSGATLPSFPPAALLSKIAGTKQNPAWIKGPE